MYHDEEVSSGKVMVVSVYRMQDAGWERIADYVSELRKSGFRTLVLVSGLPQEIDQVMEGLMPDQVNVLHQDMYMSDFKTLVSLNRSNGGLTYFSEGYLISKWASRSVPDADELSQIYKDDETEILLGRTSTSRLYFQGFKLFLFALMLLV